MPGPSAVRVCLVYPDLLGTYGDGGNALVLVQRLRWRGISAEVVRSTAEDHLPHHCDLYVIGGGEDAPQTLACSRLADDGLPDVVDTGAVVFAVCAGLQLLGNSFTAADAGPVPGLGLLQCVTRPRGERMIGELLVEPTFAPLPPLTGFENHGGITRLEPPTRPLGTVRAGFGNGAGGVEGAVSGRVVGTYLHGPALARNPLLADLLLSWVLGEDLEPIDDALVDRLRGERLAAVHRNRRAPEVRVTR